MKKILVVDDEKDILALLGERLTQSNFSVITAENGEEAIKLSKVAHPDLILLDIAMAGIDGYETCEKLKEDKTTENIPVLFLTGKDLDELVIREKCETLCAMGYISKTCSLKELIDKVKEVLFRDTF